MAKMTLEHVTFVCESTLSYIRKKIDSDAESYFDYSSVLSCIFWIHHLGYIDDETYNSLRDSASEAFLRRSFS